MCNLVSFVTAFVSKLYSFESKNLWKHSKQKKIYPRFHCTKKQFSVTSLIVKVLCIFCFFLFRFICLIPLQWRLTHSRIWLRYKTTKGGKRGEEEFELSDCLRYKNVASSTSTRQSQIINCSRLLLGGHLEKKKRKKSL